VSEPEFYVGYLPRCPPGLARRMRALAVGLLLAAGILASELALAHGLRPAARFEYGSPVELRGTLRERPFPMLEVARPGAPGPAQELPGSSFYPLVAPGKHGAAARVRGLDGRTVALQGTLAYRDGRTLVELDRIEARSLEAARALLPETLGRFTLRGEIVDSKCYLGVMTPGEGKTHKACAVRCISGGIPPMLAVRDRRGERACLLLVSPSGEPVNRAVLSLVAEPVEIIGDVARLGDLLVLSADPASYRRLE
jgi:hypothetical protein